NSTRFPAADSAAARRHARRDRALHPVSGVRRGKLRHRGVPGSRWRLPHLRAPTAATSLERDYCPADGASVFHGLMTPTAPSRISFTSILVATILAVGAVMAAAMVGRAAVQVFRIKQAEQRIVVTGSATKRIQSDFVVWRAVIKSQAADMAQAYKKLSVDV